MSERRESGKRVREERMGREREKTEWEESERRESGKRAREDRAGSHEREKTEREQSERR